MQKLFSFMRSRLSIIGNSSWANRVLLRKSFPVGTTSHVDTAYAPSGSFHVLDFTFRSSIHQELVFVQSSRHGSNFILLRVDIQFFQHHLLKMLSFLECLFWAFLFDIRFLQLHVLMFGSLVFSHLSNMYFLSTILLLLLQLYSLF